MSTDRGKINYGATDRVVALVDMDCFYCQVETRINPQLKGKPVAVVQYNQWKGGGIIAVNYEAKGKGVTRGMRGEQAKNLCPDINLVSVPVSRGKADLTKYREAGEEVAEIFCLFSDVIQRASIDEAYIDLTKATKERIKNGFTSCTGSQLKSTYVVGFSDLNCNNEEQRNAGLQEWLKLMKDINPESPDFLLTVGAVIIEEMREQILAKTGFHCSAGIAHNKILAKLVAGLHKPKCQTILPQDNVPELYDTLPVYKIKNLGGKFGKHVSEKLCVKYMSEIYKYSLKELQQKFDEKSGMWLYHIARGIDLEPVTSRLIADSIGCSKNFPGVTMLRCRESVEHWTRELAEGISERLMKDIQKNKRRARLLTVSFYQTAPVSRSDSLNTYEASGIANTALDILKKFNNAPASSNEWDPPIKFLGMSVGKFTKEQTNINTFLKIKAKVSDEGLESLTAGVLSSEEKSIPSPNTKPSMDSRASTSSENDSTSQATNENRKNNENSFFLSFLRSHREKIIESKVEIFSKNYPSRDSTENIEMNCLLNKACNEDNVVENGISLDGVSTKVEQNIDDIISETKLCEECNQNINIMDFFEHLDYHVAMRLHGEINREVNMLNTMKSASLKQNENVGDMQIKRKRLKNGKSITKKVKDIKSFFPVVTK